MAVQALRRRKYGCGAHRREKFDVRTCSGELCLFFSGYLFVCTDTYSVKDRKLFLIQVEDDSDLDSRQVPFMSESKCHNQMLQTIYRKLSNSTYDSPRFGAHWETIGFQGSCNSRRSIQTSQPTLPSQSFYIPSEFRALWLLTQLA